METHIQFFVAAVAAGLINSMAGGGGLITFPLLALVVPQYGSRRRHQRGRRNYRIRAGSVLLLGPLRSTRATLWRRVSQISRPTVEVRSRATLPLLALRTCLGAQPERGVGRLHRLSHHPYEFVAQRLQVRLVA